MKRRRWVISMFMKTCRKTDTGWRRAVRPYYFQQIRHNRRWYPHIHQTDGGNAGQEAAAVKACGACHHLSAGVEERPGKSKPEAQADPEVQAAVQDVAGRLGDSGRILVRESGTEPVIRVMVEAESEDLCEKYVNQVIDVIRARGHVELKEMSCRHFRSSCGWTQQRKRERGEHCG